MRSIHCWMTPWLVGLMGVGLCRAVDLHMQVLDPSGAPLRNMGIHLAEPEEGFEKDKLTVDSRTDDEGFVFFAWTRGPTEVTVSVPGVGYGVTGVFAIPLGAGTFIALPRLAPWAHITGVLPPECRGPGVEVEASGHFGRTHQSVAVKEGRFSAEVPAGRPVRRRCRGGSCRERRRLCGRCGASRGRSTCV